jgi:RimJ/RimL family protein N-acetyltransferase
VTQPDLSTGRFYLRPPAPEDVPDITAACQSPGFTRWTRLPADYQQEHAVAFVRRANPLKPSWMALDAVTGRVSGWVGLFFGEAGASSAEIGYWVAPWAQGRGAATESAGAVVRYAFAGLGLHRLSLQHAAPHRVSCAVAERLGFVVEGLLREAWLKDGERHDVELHSRLATDPDPARQL